MEPKVGEEWREQMKHQVNTLDKLEKYINVSDEEREAIETTETRRGHHRTSHH
jgi:lysine 2,3-aminomutase